MAKTANRDLTRRQQLARGPVDLPYLILTLLLLGIGLVMLFSASSYSASLSRAANYDAAFYFKRQTAFAVMGLVAMFFSSKFDYQRWRGLSVLVLGVAVLLLIAVIIPGVGVTHNNATRWLRIGIEFQPSEVAKLGVVLFFAAKFSKRRKDPLERAAPPTDAGGKVRRFFLGYWYDLREMAVPLAVLLLIVLLLMLEPHLSGSLLVIAAAAAILFAAGIRIGWFIMGLSCVSGVVYVVLFVIGYNGDRIKTWLDPWWDPTYKSYQILQSLYAVASGGLSGLGLGMSRQKYLYLPEEQNDFIFAIVCEELGFIGAAMIVALFALLIIRGYWLALHARDRFGALVVVGINTLMAVQVFMNIAVVTNLVPATGISLPFFSYGGTALVIQLAEIGIVLAVSRQIPAPKQG